MVSHMKTTVNLPDALLDAARAIAAREGMTFKELLEISLHREIERRQRDAEKPFRLADVVAEGHGVAPEIEEGRWFDLIYPAPGDSG
jgi:hypothetical protein